MKIQTKVRTCLWFNGKGREAAEFYVSLLPGSHLDRTFDSPDEEPLTVEFTLAGAPMMILNGGPMFEPNEAASILVMTQDQEETDALWEKLIADGGKPQQCAWLKDKFGVSWQIVPVRLGELLSHDDTEAAGRSRDAMLNMQKIDIAGLEAAFKGER